MDIKLEVIHDRAEPYRRSIVSGSKNYYRFIGVFTDDWDGLDKFLIFPDYKCSAAFSPEDTVVLPEVLIANEGVLSFGIMGKDGSGQLRISTNLMKLNISDSAVSPPSPNDINTWETYIGRIAKECIDEIKSYSSYSSNVPTTADLGGIEKGSTFENATYNELWDKLLHPYAPPIATISVAPSPSEIREIGIAVDITITANAVQGSEPITSVKINEVPISASEGVQTQTYKNINNSETFTVEVSDGKQTVTSSVDYTFVNPFYWGVFNGHDIHYEKIIETKGNKTISCQNDDLGNHYFFAYPESYGKLRKIIDQNGFDITSDFITKTLDAKEAKEIFGTDANYLAYFCENVIIGGKMKITYIF